MAADRLQKILAHAGIASRRAAEALIRDGRVRLNGRVVTELGTTADSYADKIEVDGKRVVLEKPAYYVVHKPREMVTTLSDPEGRAHLGDVLEKIPERVYPIGRLDYHTSGALLVTNDGELTDALLHPKRKVPKVYAAKLKGHLDVPELDRLRNGVTLDDGYVTKPAEVFVLREEARTTWVQITLYEGKNRQIHRMAEAIGHPVQRLVRLSFAGITTEGLRPGRWRELNRREVEKLEKTYVKPSRADKAKQTADALDRASSPVHALGDPSDREPGTWSSASKKGSAPKRSAKSGASRSGGAKREGSGSSGAPRDAKSASSRDASKRDGGRSGSRDAKSGGSPRTASKRDDVRSGRSGGRSRARDAKSGVAARDTSSSRSARDAKSGAPAGDATKRDGGRSGARDAKSGSARDARGPSKSAASKRDGFERGASGRAAPKSGAATKATKSGSPRSAASEPGAAKKSSAAKKPGASKKLGAAKKSGASKRPASAGGKRKAGGRAGARGSGS